MGLCDLGVKDAVVNAIYKVSRPQQWFFDLYGVYGRQGL